MSITYCRRAVAEMNNYEIRRGRFLGVCMSVDNCRLFVGGIPKNKQQVQNNNRYRMFQCRSTVVQDVTVFAPRRHHR